MTVATAVECAVPDRYETPIPECYIKFDFEKQLSLDLIRVHCKIDDVPSVTNEQLGLYRAAAVEAAEQYTGLLLSGRQTIIEAINRDPPRRFNRSMTYKYTLQHPTVDGVVYLYGGLGGQRAMQLSTAPGSREIHIPIQHGCIDLTPCCDPCATGGSMNFGLRIMYTAGYKDCDCIPAGIILGMLKYIAWSIVNIGDELLSQRNSLKGETSGVVGSNNTAWASGALELWRQYVPDAY